jgi:hypothetical protein
MVERPESAGQQRPPRGQRTIPSPQQRPPEPLFQVETISKRWNPHTPSSLPEQSCSSDLPTPRVGNHRTNRILSETARTRAKNADQNPAPRVNLPLPRDALFRGGPFFGEGLFGEGLFGEGELPREPQTLPHDDQLPREPQTQTNPVPANTNLHPRPSPFTGGRPGSGRLPRARCPLSPVKAATLPDLTAKNGSNPLGWGADLG